MYGEVVVRTNKVSVHPLDDASTILQLPACGCSLLHNGLNLFIGIADDDLNSPIGLAACGRVIAGHRPDLAKAAHGNHPLHRDSLVA